MILCCGEALIDMLPRQTLGGASCFQPFSGGAVFNTAIALGRLEAPVSLFSGVSNDLFGQQLTTTLTDSAVSTDLIAFSDRPSTLAFVELNEGQARYAFYDENTAGRMLAVADLPRIPEEITTLFFGGISLVVEPCASTYERLMLDMATARVTMIDPNIRPGFITDETAYRARLDRMTGAADIVKISDEDLAWLTGGGDLRDLAREMLARGPRLVCVTEGAKGAWAFTADHDVFVEAEKVVPIDTVGAGDTFNAGLLASLHADGALSKTAIRSLDRQAMERALRLANRAAGVTVSREGANPPYRSDLS